MSKFDPKSPKGSVPNVQLKFLTRDAIRWFKCKLKPPKNDYFTYFNKSILCILLQVINEVKVTHQCEGHIKVKEKYLYPFKFYVAHIFCKRVVCIRLNAFVCLFCFVVFFTKYFEIK